MRAFYGSKLSENMSTTPEGYLVCHRVPVARTGEQEYRGTDLGFRTSNVVTVYRSADEVFHPAAIASLEGKPLTMNHPPRFLDSHNVAIYSKGHVQNVRRGSDRLATGEEVLLADLIVTDAELIRQIRDGLRECSLGYELEWVQDEDGTIRQTNIRANHLAIVRDGRAGGSVRIMDGEQIDPGEEFERIAKLFHRRGPREGARTHRATDGVVGEMFHSARPRLWSELKEELNQTMGESDESLDDQYRQYRDSEAENFENLVKRERARQLRRR